MESLPEYLAQLASQWPTPGGGSAATVVGAAGAALVAMVARISSTNPKYAAYKDLANDLVASADDLRSEFLRAKERDEAAFDRVVAATAMPKDTADEKQVRRDALEIALAHAAAEPLMAAELALETLRLTARLLEIPNKNLTSDVGCAAEFAAASLAACAYNVRINHKFMRDTDAIEAQAHVLARYERESAALLAGVRRSLT
ncbi:MAG: cyclodeaminase/cyclohydrolase family protein [Candidatus Eremiobacteraeota bacterium]|nr:cyclodeaminase/cyclohydrolase family protein [Candidatus Eremiobacteraeota bacterium]